MIIKTKTKKKKRIIQPEEFTSDEKNSSAYRDAVWRQLCNMKHKDLQKACILRGLEPENVVGFDHHKLVVWFYDNYNNGQDETLLVIFDDWKEKEFIKAGIPEGDPLRNPVLRLSYIKPIVEGIDPIKINTSKEEITKAILPEEPKVEKYKHEEWDIQSGTKKFFTYELTIIKKLDINEIVGLVMTKYPEAQDKSIRIWYKRALKFKK